MCRYVRILLKKIYVIFNCKNIFFVYLYKGGFEIKIDVDRLIK